MKVRVFDDIITMTENYKRKIRGAEYDETVRGNTKELIEFLFTNDNNESREVLVEFEVEFLFSFEDGFHYTKFNNFIFNYPSDNFDYPDNMEYQLESYIINEFVNVDRLSE
jgi:hypothetical protein